MHGSSVAALSTSRATTLFDLITSAPCAVPHRQASAPRRAIERLLWQAQPTESGQFHGGGIEVEPERKPQHVEFHALFEGAHEAQ